MVRGVCLGDVDLGCFMLLLFEYFDCISVMFGVEVLLGFLRGNLNTFKRW